MTTRAQAATAALVAPAPAGGIRYSWNPMATFNGAPIDYSTKEN